MLPGPMLEVPMLTGPMLPDLMSPGPMSPDLISRVLSNRISQVQTELIMGTIMAMPDPITIPGTGEI